MAYTESRRTILVQLPWKMRDLHTKLQKMHCDICVSQKLAVPLQSLSSKQRKRPDGGIGRRAGLKHQ